MYKPKTGVPLNGSTEELAEDYKPPNSANTHQFAATGFPNGFSHPGMRTPHTPALYFIKETTAIFNASRSLKM